MNKQKAEDTLDRFGKALLQLQESVDDWNQWSNEGFPHPRVRNYLRDSVIKRFEFTLGQCGEALKALMDEPFLTLNDTIKEAYRRGMLAFQQNQNSDDIVINDKSDTEQRWLRILDSMRIERNKTAHEYAEENANLVLGNIVNEYTELLKEAHSNMIANICKYLGSEHRGPIGAPDFKRQMGSDTIKDGFT